MLVPIKFTTKQAPYMAGEIAGFELAVSQAYVDAGVAVMYRGEHADDSHDDASSGEGDAEEKHASARGSKKRG